MTKIVILHNRIQCTHCGDIIESTYTHDFKWCSCGKVAVDGGKQYMKRSFTYSPNDYIELSETSDEVNDDGIKDKC